MARISGVTLPNDKQIQIALTYVYGIGPKTAKDILEDAKVEPTLRVNKMTDGDIRQIQNVIDEKLTVEGELQRIVTANIKRLKEIKSYRGLRHTASLPSRGQRTKTNARTRRGKKVTVGGTKQKAPSKT